MTGRACRFAAGAILSAFLLAIVLPLVCAGKAEAAEGAAVFDYQDLLTAEEEAELTSRFRDFEKAHGIRLFLMTPGVQEVGGYTDQDSIDYIEAFAEKEIGGDCLGLLVNMDTRYFYIDVYGAKSIAAFTDDKQEKLEEAVIEELYTENIYGAGLAFVKTADRWVDYDPRSGRTAGAGVAAGVIGLVGSLGMVGSKSRKHKEKTIATDADIYADPASLHLVLNRDNFSHQYVTRVARIQNSRGGGFGSGFGGGHTTTHTSFGGGTHSGGGGHF